MAKGKIDFVFKRRTKHIPIAKITPLRLVAAGTKTSSKFRQVHSSVKEIGLVEPPVVALDKSEPGTYILLDGHMRLEVLKELGIDKVECLIATDDEAFTYNKRISRIATIQEHAMILKAIERGVSEERIAQVMNVNVAQIRMKSRLLRGICPEVAEMLKDKHVPLNTFVELRKMIATRQIEAAQLMVAMNKFSVPYAKSLVGATPQNQLISRKPKQVKGLTKEQMDLMERESEVLDREVRLIEETYGTDHLDLVVATGYLSKMLENAAIVRFLAQKFPELLAEFQRISETDIVSV